MEIITRVNDEFYEKSHNNWSGILQVDLLLRKLENKSFIRRIHQISTHSFVK